MNDDLMQPTVEQLAAWRAESNERLRAAGYTDAQIRAMRRANDAAREDAIDAFERSSGR